MTTWTGREGGGGQKMSVLAEGIKTVYTGGGGGKKWQNSVHVVVECPLIRNGTFILNSLASTNVKMTSVNVDTGRSLF